ncbi:hypothetical protein PPERSA_02062 [Pseudocohnilembus persalinus]|uniref:Uncharacterized protein n=1 Tax=Pseudocohnilembus persalinus TaxID=266149 RepID=A0A0V0QF97_PSEPJ|nr:hypothetical protein PPERSA_02062 [Pseudocohnilembus persalinus]|eukprot:KRX00883.1 hypothetical protein PPERSA_02062 [Pseudocohnilembus persalinus]
MDETKEENQKQINKQNYQNEQETQQIVQNKQTDIKDIQNQNQNDQFQDNISIQLQNEDQQNENENESDYNVKPNFEQETARLIEKFYTKEKKTLRSQKYQQQFEINNYKPEPGYYQKLDMEKAIQYVFRNSHKIKQKIKQLKITDKFLEDNVYLNKHFLLVYDGFLQQFLNEGVLQGDFRTVAPKIFVKIEKFVLEQLVQIWQEQSNIDEYNDQITEINQLFKERLGKLEEDIEISIKKQIQFQNELKLMSNSEQIE